MDGAARWKCLPDLPRRRICGSGGSIRDQTVAKRKEYFLAKDKDVRTGEFGSEGSGGQSFLNRARPDGRGNTICTAWFFGPEVGEWKFIASFRRPETDKHLTGLHSFLENFASDRTGYQGRMAYYGNQWARDTGGNWHELTKAHFTGDNARPAPFCAGLESWVKKPVASRKKSLPGEVSG
jgi:hypothetical protein